MREERFAGCGGTVTLHADKGSARPEPALPAELDRGLDGNARRRAEDRIPVFLGCLLEQLPTRHRDDRRADMILSQRLASGHRDRDLGAGGEQGHLAGAISLGEDISAARRAVLGSGLAAQQWERLAG